MSIQRKSNSGHISEQPDGTKRVELPNGKKIERHLETKMGDDGVEEVHLTFGNKKSFRVGRATERYDSKTRTFIKTSLGKTISEAKK